jgi:integrase/recombinase XerD
VDAATITLSDAQDIYILDCRARALSSHTLTLYSGAIRRFIETVGDKPLRSIGASDVRQFMAAQVEAGAAASYARIQLTVIKIWFSFLVAEGLIEASPADRVKYPRLPRKTLPPYTPDELRILLDYPTSHRDRALVHVLADTGIRAAELLALNIEDVNIQAGTAYIAAGKGDKPRTVRYGAATAKQLRIYLAHRGNPPSGPLWLSLRGTRFQYPGLQAMFRRWSQRLDMPVSAHRFRRTFCVTMIRNGCDLYSLILLTGHSDVRQLAPYVALAESDTERAQRQFGVIDNL